MAQAKYKPLSFSTTMRNPNRLSAFLQCVLPFENQLLTNDIILEITYTLIEKKLYAPMYINKKVNYKKIYNSEELEFTRKQAIDIVNHAPQHHKEAGFEEGWPSRFDTWYKFSKELGLVYYEMNQPIIISKTGHMLVDAIKTGEYDEEKIENVFCNAFMKYPSNNPFRKNLNSNVPLVLLLKVIDLLNKDPECSNNGIFRMEIPIFLCWPDGNAEELYLYIKQLRKEASFSYSDEYIYDRCLKLLHAGEKDKKYFKISKICRESVDEYIRKMRMTGLLSLRGNGRFLDYNKFKIDRISYILNNYQTTVTITDEKRYFDFIAEIDQNIMEIKEELPEGSDEIRKNTIIKFAKEYSKESILSELILLNIGKKESQDPVFRFINAPARLEFLTSIALKQAFESLDVNPQYSYDDEGLPTSTAGGGISDIICHDGIYNELVEVTLMRGRSDQVNNEIIPISRHQRDARNDNPNTFSIFIAPVIHEDTKNAIEWQNMKYGVDIYSFDISEFVKLMDEKEYKNLNQMFISL